MSDYKQIFERSEKKYLLSPLQYTALTQLISSHIHPDEYGESTVCSLYFDTPDFRMIRRSLEGGEYKEKLRVRCYGKANEQSTVFVELKKKYRGIVYKRRTDMNYSDARNWLVEGERPQKEGQITDEIKAMLGFYKDIAPAMMISCRRSAWFENGNDDLRITFDSDIRWRVDDLSLSAGAGGEEILNKGWYLMEIKAFKAMPLWLTQALSKLKIYPVSFSKYGRGFTAYSKNPHFYQNKVKGDVIRYA